jgi:hypothetical protein
MQNYTMLLKDLKGVLDKLLEFADVNVEYKEITFIGDKEKEELKELKITNALRLLEAGIFTDKEAKEYIDAV